MFARSRKLGILSGVLFALLVGPLAMVSSAVEITGAVPDSDGNYAQCNYRQQNLDPISGSAHAAIIEATCNYGGSSVPTAMRVKYRTEEGGTLYTDGMSGALGCDYSAFNPPKTYSIPSFDTDASQKTVSSSYCANFGSAYPLVDSFQVFVDGSYRTTKLVDRIPSIVTIFRPTDYYTGGVPGGAPPCTIKSWDGPSPTDSFTKDDSFSSTLEYFPSGVGTSISPRVTVRYARSGDPGEDDPTIFTFGAPVQGPYDVTFDWPRDSSPSDLHLRAVCKYTDSVGAVQTRINNYGSINYQIGDERQFSLSECLDGAGLTLNPTSWVPGLIKDGACMLRWAFIPEQSPFDGLKAAWDGSGASVVALPVTAANAGWSSFSNGWDTRDTSCGGPDFTIPTGPFGGGFDMAPLSTCSGPMQTVSGLVRPLSTFAFIFLGLMAVTRLVLGAFGLEAAPGSRPPDEAAAS